MLLTSGATIYSIKNIVYERQTTNAEIKKEKFEDLLENLVFCVRTSMKHQTNFHARNKMKLM